ncbi:unnamed protein product [Arabis nemorensis]|uniref:AT-hook motif nuclear-localized protein n=1 Tax=Arabis nemorensis TaxID=586526 RepID=A0A565CGH0_9BRAS|nr:unnamed protein product [Arabis nemorensis]
MDQKTLESLGFEGSPSSVQQQQQSMRFGIEQQQQGKKKRGRPRKYAPDGGTGGVGFTPHVIEVKTGEDIAMKVRAFSLQGPRAICILSATGAVSGVMLRQATNSNGAVKHHEM